MALLAHTLRMPCLSKICPNWTKEQISKNWPKKTQYGSFFKQKYKFYEDTYFSVDKLILEILSSAC